MDTIIVMCIGILIGKLITSKKIKKANEIISLTCTFLLIFSMGIMLGNKENFLQELSSLGWYSFLLFIIPTALSIIIVYVLTQCFMHHQFSINKKRCNK